jgi:hypothetical protein
VDARAPGGRIEHRILGRLRAASSSTISHHGDGRRAIDAIDGHLLPDSEDYLRGLLDVYDDGRGLSADRGGRCCESPALYSSADERT